MSKTVSPIPQGQENIIPHLVCSPCTEAIEFYKKALNAQVINRSDMPNGKVMHASLKIGDSILMLNDEFPEWGGSPAPRGEASGLAIHVYVDNVDKLFAQAVSAGATVKMPLMDQFWGDRAGTLLDPFGYKWSIATRKEDLSPKEMERRQNEFMKDYAPQPTSG